MSAIGRSPIRCPFGPARPAKSAGRRPLSATEPEPLRGPSPRSPHGTRTGGWPGDSREAGGTSGDGAVRGHRGGPGTASLDIASARADQADRRHRCSPRCSKEVVKIHTLHNSRLPHILPIRRMVLVIAYFSAHRRITFRPRTDDGSPAIGHALRGETERFAPVGHAEAMPPLRRRSRSWYYRRPHRHTPRHSRRAAP